MSCNSETITYCITSYIDKTFKYLLWNQLQGALIIFKHICEISKYLFPKYTNMSAQTLKRKIFMRGWVTNGMVYVTAKVVSELFTCCGTEKVWMNEVPHYKNKIWTISRTPTMDVKRTILYWVPQYCTKPFAPALSGASESIMWLPTFVAQIAH